MKKYKKRPVTRRELAEYESWLGKFRAFAQEGHFMNHALFSANLFETRLY